MFFVKLWFVIVSCVGAITVIQSRMHPRTDTPVVHISKGVAIVDISPPTKRIVEIYNFTEITRVYGREFAGDLWDVASGDQLRDSFIPSADSKFSENTPYGRIVLGRIIASSEQSVIYEIVGIPGLLIKYQANCVELDPEYRLSDTSYVHPLVVDYIYGRKAARAKVGPAIFFLSPPGRLCVSRGGKCVFKMNAKDFQSCVNRDGATLRYMLMERIQGESLYAFKSRFRKGIVPLYTSLLIGNAMIASLERLHKVAKTIHGDIHTGNVLLERVDVHNGTVCLKFVDYGRSFSNIERVNHTVRDVGWAEHFLFSSWELEGYEPAARDDIERAVQATAHLMMPWSYIETEQRIAEFGADALIHWKRSYYWFVEPRLARSLGYDPVQALEISDDYRTPIRYNLQLIQGMVREMKHVNTIPPYSDLLHGFRATRGLVQVARASYIRQRIDLTRTIAPSSSL